MFPLLSIPVQELLKLSSGLCMHSPVLVFCWASTSISSLMQTRAHWGHGTSIRVSCSKQFIMDWWSIFSVLYLSLQKKVGTWKQWTPVPSYLWWKLLLKWKHCLIMLLVVRYDTEHIYTMITTDYSLWFLFVVGHYWCSTWPNIQCFSYNCSLLVRKVIMYL